MDTSARGENKMLRYLVLLFSLFVSTASAQDYPNRPIKMIVPFAPGGAVDIVARIVTEKMRDTLGQPFIIENKTGAAGLLGVNEMARSQPDGYTLELGNNNSNVFAPLLYRKRVNVDVERDIVPVARIADLPNLIVATTKGFPPNSFREFVEYAKQNDVRYSSSGVGTFPHLDMEMLARRAGFVAMHVPNASGAGNVVNDLITGTTQVSFLNVATSQPMIQAGLLKPLAVITEERLPDYPDVPTLTELGYPGIGTVQWFVIFAPRNVPPAVINKIHQTAVLALQTSWVQDRFKPQSIRARPSKEPSEAQAFVAKELEFWRKALDDLKIEGVN
jgi:tripartite-type tricarboxylate transporter receptor subunit TctC